MFLEASDNELKFPKQIENPMDPEKVKKFRSLSHKIMKINSVLSGVGEYFPVTFE